MSSIPSWIPSRLAPQALRGAPGPGPAKRPMYPDGDARRGIGGIPIRSPTAWTTAHYSSAARFPCGRFAALLRASPAEGGPARRCPGQPPGCRCAACRMTAPYRIGIRPTVADLRVVAVEDQLTLCSLVQGSPEHPDIPRAGWSPGGTADDTGARRQGHSHVSQLPRRPAGQSGLRRQEPAFSARRSCRCRARRRLGAGDLRQGDGRRTNRCA